jgi:CheY-like chemotaxis protein
MRKKLNCILLIDDDEPTNYISSMLVEEAACTEHIQIAQSGQAALDYLTSSEQFACKNELFPCPDLIFLDINMPAMNGWEFLEKYSKLQQKNKGEIILVMLTTSLNPDDELRAKEMSFISGFENKPLTSEKLNRILQEYFPIHFSKQQDEIYNR